jgi:amidophosphoribosyltransferase
LSYEANLRRAFEGKARRSDVSGMLDFFRSCKGGFSYIAVNDRSEMIAGRGPLGVKPLVLGKMGFDGGIVASESCVMDIIGERVPISPAENIEPGEVRIFTTMSAHSETLVKPRRRAYCSFG